MAKLLIPDDAKGYVWEIGSSFKNRKIQTFGQFKKTGKGFRYGMRDGPEEHKNGRYHGYRDCFVTKTTPFGHRYIFYIVRHYSENEDYTRGRGIWVMPNSKNGKAYKFWKEVGMIVPYPYNDL